MMGWGGSSASANRRHTNGDSLFVVWGFMPLTPDVQTVPQVRSASLRREMRLLLGGASTPPPPAGHVAQSYSNPCPASIVFSPSEARLPFPVSRRLTCSLVTLR